MRLEDLNRVAQLGKERDYAKQLVGLASPHHKMRLDDVDVRPDLKAKLLGPMTEVFKADIARIEAIWAEALAQHRGPFLFGRSFGLADAMFAPVVTRFLTWRPRLASVSEGYCQAVRTHALVERWYREALEEPPEWFLDKYENPQP